MINSFVKSKIQKGLSLIEASMVLVLSAVVVAGVMTYYQTAQTNSQLEKTTAQVMHIVSEINGLYAGHTAGSEGLYEGLSVDTLASAIPDIETTVIDGSQVIKTALPDFVLGVESTGDVLNNDPKKNRFWIYFAGSTLDTKQQIKACQKIVALNFNGQAELFIFNDGSSYLQILASAPLADKFKACQSLPGYDGAFGIVFK